MPSEPSPKALHPRTISPSSRLKGNPPRHSGNYFSLRDKKGFTRNGYRIGRARDQHPPANTVTADIPTAAAFMGMDVPVALDHRIPGVHGISHACLIGLQLY